MNIDSDYVFLAVIIALLLMVRAARVRWRRQRVAHVDSVTESIGDRMARRSAEYREDAATPVCPICGKFDDRNPFIKHAMECHRRDCGA